MSSIIPVGTPPGGATVRRFDFQVRTLLDYDVNFMQDRVHSTIFVDGKPSGAYAAMRVEDAPRTMAERREVIEHYGPYLERMVIDTYLGLGYQAEIQALQAHINRPRWWQLRRRRTLAEALRRVRAWL